MLPSATPSRGGDSASAANGASATNMVAWNVDHVSKLRQKMDHLRSEKEAEWTWDELILYLRQYRRIQESTIEHHLRQLRFMARHTAMPVALTGPKDLIVNSFLMYVTHRETVEEVPPTATINDYRSIRILGDFLGIPREVWPTMPTLPAHDELDLPSPDMVREIIHTDFLPNAKRNYENALIRYLLAFDFGFGIRFPSEPFAMRLHDFDPDRHILTITEPKKSGRRRRVLIEPEWLCCSKRHMSLENWLRWRDKLSPETDALFPNPQGNQYGSKFSLNQLLYRRVVPNFPWFNPYLGRHWSVNARLIEWDMDYARVAQWHGHESVNRTKNSYEHSARLHRSLYGDDWLLRAFQKPPRTAQRPILAESVQFPLSESDGSARI